MKKIFSFVAVAAMIFGLASCEKPQPGPGPEPQPQPTPGLKDTVELSFTNESLIWNDQVEAQGWWQMRGSDSVYFVTLSNDETIGIEEAAGEYTVDDLDPDYSFVRIRETNEDIAFLDGKCVIETPANGDVKVEGAFVGEDSILYVLHFQYTKPGDPEKKAEVDVTISDGGLTDLRESAGLFQFTGTSDDEAYVVYLCFGSEEIAGTYTIEDLVNLGSYTAIVNIETQDAPDFFSADITITGDDENGYHVLADVLCYDSILYKIDLTYAPAEITDLAFEFAENEEGITVTPSYDDQPWDWYVADKATVEAAGADYIAEYMCSYYGAYFAVEGEQLLAWDDIVLYCTDDDYNFVPGDYVLITWGASDNGLTSEVATHEFSIDEEPADELLAPAKARKLNATKLAVAKTQKSLKF